MRPTAELEQSSCFIVFERNSSVSGCAFRCSSVPSISILVIQSVFVTSACTMYGIRAFSQFHSSLPDCIKHAVTKNGDRDSGISQRSMDGLTWGQIVGKCDTKVASGNVDVYRTRINRSKNMERLQSGYLFTEMSVLKSTHNDKYPEAKLITLGVGDTTHPIPEVISKAMAESSLSLSTVTGYKGYGDEQGDKELRKAVAEIIYQGLDISCNDIFISDGAQCDISRFQLLLGPDITVAVQDPTFPAYVDSSVITGHAGEYITEVGAYGRITYMKCTPANNFFPDLSFVPRTDIIFFCSPNNPTGIAATREQLKSLVDFARGNGSIIIYDSAYSVYISDDSPRTIFEIPGAKEVAIEISSFSKFAGFTGVRLGWTVVPKELLFSDGSPVAQDFHRVICTCFNGASNIAQAGGLACLSSGGYKAVQGMVKYYQENAAMIVETFELMGFTVYGGKNSPYAWVHFPGRKAWEVFSEVLEKAHVLTIPGTGFGPGGEGFIRVSSFASRDNIAEACQRLKKILKC